MNTNKDPEEKFLFCTADISSLFRRSKKKILCWAFALGIMGVFWALITPIRYQAEGTFREKGVQSNHSLSSSVLQIIGAGSFIGGDSEAASLMSSRKILKDVIEKLGLQANLETLSDLETTPLLVKRNLQIAWAAVFSRSRRPVLEDIFCPLKIESLQYTGEIPLTYLIDLKEDRRFEVFDVSHSKQSLGWGKLGEPFQFDQLSMTLVPADSDQFAGASSFVLTVNSLSDAAKGLSQVLKVELSKLDKGLLTLKCEHRKRKVASEIINTLMDSYQSYLKNYHAEVAFKQLDYLSVRQNRLTQNLTDLMESHADLLSKDLYNSGFIESNKEMDFLAKSQHDYKRKLLDNELEIKRLTNIKPGNLAYYDRYSDNEGDPAVINAILSEMRSLKQQRDSLEIELQKKPIHQGANLQQSFEQHLNELKEVQQYLLELREIGHQYEQGNLPNPDSKLLNDSRFLLKGWFERLQSLQDHSNNWKETNENFKFYITNLERLFGVHERILQERLTHQQNPSGEYQGISLELATHLYLDYSRQLVQMEGTIRQNLFFIHQIEDPNFEITSLSSGLNDHVSSAMIQKASELVLNLRDLNNQSIREQERIKHQLDLQRTFLTLHLKQMVQLMELNKQLIDEKVFALQNVSLELIHQRISLLEKNLQDYLKSRLHNLHQERSLIKRHLDSLHADMALIPQKWVSEQILDQAVTTNQRIVEEIAHIVESKNISHNLEVIQSAPIDLAIPPVHPVVPRIFLWGFLGFILGGGLGSCFVLGKGLSKGLKVSAENLELMGCHVSGNLTSPLFSPATKRLREGNFDTLRRLQAYFDTSVLAEGTSSDVQESKLLLLIEGQGPEYAADLADLFLKRGRRVLTLNLDFTETKASSLPGLLHYLQGEISSPPIQKGEHGDWIAAGGASDYVIEMIGSPFFQQLIEQLKPHYDWIVVVSRVLPCSAEAESLVALFPYAAITLKQEKITELNIYASFLKESPPHKLTFILTVPN